MTGAGPWRWSVGTDADEVHALLCASDAHQARPGAPAPARNIESTRRHVRAGAVHVLRYEREAAAMFTLTAQAPFAEALTLFGPCRRAAYLSRLAVQPRWLAPPTLIGARCLRRALELAARQGAEVLRSEANPDLVEVTALLERLGFRELWRTRDETGRARAYFQHSLLPGEP